MSTGQVFSIGQLHEARARISGLAVVTPLLNSAHLDELTGGRILIKPETLQRTGSFKFRGALNKLLSIPQSDRQRGVVAVSSGNHGQGVAEAARLLGIQATIIMPTDTPAIKVARCKRSLAEVITYDREKDDRDALLHAFSERTGAIVVHPYDDHSVMAGQGTAGLEIADQARALGLKLDVLLSCCGGGGLTAGLATAIHASFAQAQIYAVEPEGFDDTARSLAAGTQVENARKSGSICDAILTPKPGLLTFPVNKALLTGALSVSDDDVLKAMAFAFNELKLVVEPGGAAALAAVLAGKIETKGRTVALILSGGNVSAPMMARALGLS